MRSKVMKLVCIAVISLTLMYTRAEHAPTILHQKATWITQQLFNALDMHLSPARIASLESLTHDLLESSAYDLEKIAVLASEKIDAQKKIIESGIAALEGAEKPIPPKLFFDRFVLGIYSKHLHDYTSSLQKTMTLKDKVHGFTAHTLALTKSYFQQFYNAQPSWYEKIAQEVVDYCDFERAMLLADYQTVSKFLHNATHGLLPPMIQFWQNPETRNSLRIRSKLLTPEVRTQFWAEIGMIALQSIFMGGSSMYNTYINEEDQQVFEQYAKQQEQIQNDFSAFIRQTKDAQSAIRKTLTNAFVASAKNAAEQYQAQNQQYNDETIYLFKAINLNPPITHDLEYPSIWNDQQFEFSPMNTPQSIAWHNVFQINGSDWEYDLDRNSFWQNGLSTFDPTNPQMAQRDHIFTEYSSPKAQYTIEVECRLINATYPFFAGIMFNKARWISAAPERYLQCRMVGLYGTTDATMTTSSVALCFAEQKILKTQKDSKDVITILTPVEQMMQSDQTHFYKFADSDRAALVKEPLSLVFSIVTEPTKATITITKKGQTNQPLAQKTFDDLKDPYIAIFGGIGFVATGCQAEFTLKKPEALVFTAAQMSNYKKPSTQAIMKKIKK